LKELPNLRRIFVRSSFASGFDDEGLAGFAELPHLTELNLAASRVTVKGLVHLRKMQNLRRLELPAHPTITPQEEQALKKDMPQCWIYKMPF
jgi:hypothetical protein